MTKLTPEQIEPVDGKPNPALITAWVEKLEDGTYKQCRKVLCRQTENERSYCCLGVLADVVEPENWTGPYMSGARPHRGDVAMLAVEFQRKLAFSDNTLREYSAANDRGDSFLKLARRIRNEFGLPPRGWDKVET